MNSQNAIIDDIEKSLPPIESPLIITEDNLIYGMARYQQYRYRKFIKEGKIKEAEEIKYEYSKWIDIDLWKTKRADLPRETKDDRLKWLNGDRKRLGLKELSMEEYEKRGKTKVHVSMERPYPDASLDEQDKYMIEREKAYQALGL